MTNLKINLVFVLFFCACSTKMAITPLETEASGVQIAISEPTNCIRLGEIEGYRKNSHGGLNLQELRASIKNELKNKTHGMGGDTLVIIGADSISSNGGYYSTRSFYHPYDFYVPYSYPKEYIMDAIAYKCKLGSIQSVQNAY